MILIYTQICVNKKFQISVIGSLKAKIARNASDSAAIEVIKALALLMYTLLILETFLGLLSIYIAVLFAYSSYVNDCDMLQGRIKVRKRKE